MGLVPGQNNTKQTILKLKKSLTTGRVSCTAWLAGWLACLAWLNGLLKSLGRRTGLAGGMAALTCWRDWLAGCFDAQQARDMLEVKSSKTHSRDINLRFPPKPKGSMASRHAQTLQTLSREGPSKYPNHIHKLPMQAHNQSCLKAFKTKYNATKTSQQYSHFHHAISSTLSAQIQRVSNNCNKSQNTILCCSGSPQNSVSEG